MYCIHESFFSHYWIFIHTKGRKNGQKILIVTKNLKRLIISNFTHISALRIFFFPFDDIILFFRSQIAAITAIIVVTIATAIVVAIIVAIVESEGQSGFAS